MKFAAIVALLCVGVAAAKDCGKGEKEEFRCIPDMENKSVKPGEAQRKKCAVFAVTDPTKKRGSGLGKQTTYDTPKEAKTQCNKFKFKGSNDGCKWAKGCVSTQYKKYEVPKMEPYKNKQPNQAIVSRTETHKDVDWKYVLKWETVEEMEYHGQMEVSGDDTEVPADPNSPCPGAEMIRDCNGKCAPAYWLGNGVCDNGQNRRTQRQCGVVMNMLCDRKCAKVPAYDKEACQAKCQNNDALKKKVVMTGCVWYMDQLPAYGNTRMNEKDVGIYNFNCAAFWNDGGDCNNKGRTIQGLVRSAYYKYSKAAKSTSFNLQVLASPAAVPVVAVAALAAVAAVAIKRRQ